MDDFEVYLMIMIDNIIKYSGERGKSTENYDYQSISYVNY